MTDKDEIAKAMRLAIAELLAHGGSDADVETLRQQFGAMADDEDAKLTDKQIPG